MYTLMLDSNSFDYIYDNMLADKVQKAVIDGKVQLFATDAQKQEIEKISNNTRKQGIKQMAEDIQVTFIETSAMVAGLDKPGKKGFSGSRAGLARVVSDEDAQLLEQLKDNSMNPLKNTADLLTFYTAYKRNMDYLITADIHDFKKSLELFKIKRGTKLQLKDNVDINDLL
jgi:hypothetical protein